ncbi:helix-hairpin-helix domain-containing protein [Rhizohabitans arisaemae]|uniref:helix-hairpin-helix domain-containing protein n=1 Tax=Rhizohabitans arisaemae TaxID=2720610 RepID=UPI0024B1BC5E|nr:helix-hairpin-helix domain-containing protein [Rhizohabitans arisaemae]
MTRTARTGAEQDADFIAGFGEPARRALAGAGYTTPGLLASADAAAVLRLHGIGPKVLNRIREALAEQGLSFADER